MVWQEGRGEFDDFIWCAVLNQ